MDIEADLARQVLVTRPLEATRVLEALPADEAAGFLADVEPAAAAGCLGMMHGPAAAAVLEVLDPARAAAIAGALPVDVAAACLRRVSEERRSDLLSRLGGRSARALGALLRFQPNTAGALMDPNVLAVPADLGVEAARRYVRTAAGEARYNVYTVDREQHLVGVFNLRELFLAEPDAPLSSIARANPHRLVAEADRHAILTHPGWRQVHSLPVIDGRGVYMGAVRYRTLRRLEEELRGRDESGATARALGDLFRTGATSLLEAVATTAARGTSHAS